MQRFPAELADLLTPRGRRILAGRDRALSKLLEGAAPRFLALDDVVDARKARGCLRLLERSLAPALVPIESAIPPESIFGMTENYSEQLPKTVRARTALLESARGRTGRIAEEIGLVAFLRSPSFRAFAAALCRRRLRTQWGIQALRYGPGDYAGPHNDHHPEDPEARDGYFDVHLSFASAAVDHQWLVYSQRGHLSGLQPVHTLGGVTAYRLPFWHYTTPLSARRGRSASAHRWVLLGTFLYDDLPR